MMRSPWTLGALLVFVAAAAVHATSLQGGFVYDDHRFIEHNESIRSVPWTAAFSDPATTSHSDGITHDIYRPLRTLLYSFEYALFAGERADGTIDYNLPWWHLVSVLLHALNAVLVVRVLRPLVRGAIYPAVVGGLIFALHPLTSESVAWLSSQGDLLAMTFLLGALIALERRGTRRTVAGAGLFLLACLAKESALILPLLLVLRDVALPREEENAPSPWARQTWVRAGTLAGLACLYFVLRMQVVPELKQVDHVEGSVFATARAMCNGMLWYAGALLAPFGFSFDTRIDVPVRWTDPEVWVGLGILGTLITAGVVGLARKRYLLAFATLGVLVALGPVSNLIVPLKTFVADRFFYPALLLAGVGVAAVLLHLSGTARTAVMTVAVFVLAGFAWLTIERNAAWGDELSLWQAVRQDRPWNANAYQGIAYEFAREKRVADAENAFTTYLEANPFDGKSLYVMGNLLGDVADALTPRGRLESGTNIPLRRRQALVGQISLYRRALEVWDVPGGMELGRGSPAMRYAMLERWRTAAVHLGDLREAKRANDHAILLEALDRGWEPRDKNPMPEPGWHRRRIRANFALRAVLKLLQGDAIPKELREQIQAVRAAVLADAGLEPDASIRSQIRPLIRLFTALKNEARQAADLDPDERLFVILSRLHRRENEFEQARRVLLEGVRIHPGSGLLKEELRGLEAFLRSRRGG